VIYRELSNHLYHGSTIEVSVIDLSLGVTGKDFGRGFYTTTSRDQAEKFACIKGKRVNCTKGYVSVFQYNHDPKISIKKFENADIEWLSFVLKNRSYPSGQTASFAEPIDVVIGPVANDAVGLTLNKLIIGTYGDPLSLDAQNTAIRLLNTTKLYNQVFFGTEQAISCLQFVEAFELGIN
jgi:hypothetical protein